jgi:glyoxalase family protein
VAVKLEGIHHVTCITGNAPANVEFYAGTLGLRLVKKTVNQDDPTVYHLFYADEKGSAGSDITFFEYPGAAPGRAGAGMVHTVVWRVGSVEALDFWAERLEAEGHPVTRGRESLRFADPEGLEHELAVAHVPDEPLVADHPEIPRALALQGFEGVHAYARDAESQTAPFLAALGFEQAGEGQRWDTRAAQAGSVTGGAGNARPQDLSGRWETRGPGRGGWIEYEPAPAEEGISGAGTVHHVAWASTMDEHEAWRQRVLEAGGRPTPVIDRFWFRSIYFREPSGVLFEIATLGPGFATDEAPEHLGEKLILPPDFEHLRAQVEPVLTPLPNPRESWTHA